MISCAFNIDFSRVLCGTILFHYHEIYFRVSWKFSFSLNLIRNDRTNEEEFICFGLFGFDEVKPFILEIIVKILYINI